MTFARLSRPVRYGIAVVGAALGLTALAPTLDAQDPNHVTPALLRRIAEAVEGHPTGMPIYVIADYRFPHHVYAVLSDREAAVAESATIAREEAESTPGWFGPYVSPVEPESPMGPPEGPAAGATGPIAGGWTPPGCIHDRLSNMIPRVMCPPEWMPQEDIIDIRIIYELRSGETLTRPVPLTADAIFFTLPALDKFVFPYYAGVLGMRYAMHMRRGVIQGMMP